MDSIELIQTFREVTRRGSFSAAGRVLDLSPASVSKYIAALEQRFGVRLFHRTTRKVTLTDAGQLLYERSGPVLELIQMTASDLAERATRPSGLIRMTAPPGLIQIELLARFLVRYPEVALNLQLSSRVVDLVDEGVDIALRAGRIKDQNLIVRRLVQLQHVVAASPAYWRAHGVPAHPRELADHPALCFALPDQVPHWQFVDGGKPLALSPRPRVIFNDAASLPVLALHDLGVIYLPRVMIDAELKKGTLVPVLGDYIPQDFWIYAAYAQRRHNSAALRALLEFLQSEFAARPAET
jgi:DNA-binding transcriptional LysR family regulator